ncbi:MAG TPA: tetratricopeptide repeat protein [Desulfobulbus sp.]|nr:tetratricopeptide repeat protein [Desulfobulbus sp.]
MYTDQSQRLTVKDCSLLAPVLEQVVSRLFPVPAAVRLWYEGKKESCISIGPEFPDGLRQCIVEYIAEFEQSTAPCFRDGILLCPVPLADEQRAFFVFFDTDPALLKKFSSDWLQTFQGTVRKHLAMVRQVYRDPETGLHNGRAMEYLVSEVSSKRDRLAIYLISVHFIRRSNKGISRKIKYLSRLLCATDNRGLFFLGQGLFALVVECDGQKQRRRYAHRLQKYLRKKGVQKVHIAFSSLTNERKTSLQADLFQALAVAERRGPFGLCDTDVLREDVDHPFSLPQKNVLRKLRAMWRGKNSFTLALFSRDDHDTATDPLSTVVTPLLSKQQHCVACGNDEVYVFSTGSFSSQDSSRFREMAASISSSGGDVVSVGFSRFPCLKFTKTDTIRNCRKALMHASFYDAGSVVAFDHLSLNVSGDYSFDEGDFRQAVREYSLGLQLYPGEKNLLNSLGVALMEMNRVHDAIESFCLVLAQEPDNHMALMNLGYAYLRQGNDLQALVHFEKALAVHYHLSMAGTDIYRQLARLYCRMERYQEALSVLDRWRQTQDDDGKLLLHRLSGQAYAGTGETFKAMQSLQNALRLHPHDVESMSMLGLLYVEQGEGEETGFLLLKKALSLDENECESWYRYARALLFVGREKEALSAVGRSLRFSRTHAKAMMLQAEILDALAKKKQAGKVLDRLLKRKDLLLSERKEAEIILRKLSEAA